MFSLIKLITGLLLISGVAIYGGDIWNGIKDRVSLFTNPELQRANILDSFKNNFSQVENIIKELNENAGNPEFAQKAKLEEAAKLIEESKNNFQEIENSDETFIEKSFEAARDLKEGVRSLITGNDSQECQCSLGE